MTYEPSDHSNRRLSILAPFMMLPLVIFAQTSIAQVPDVRAREQIEGLRQQDASLRSSIQGQRIDRQAEIGRLEARIANLERLMRGRPQPYSNAGLISLINSVAEKPSFESAGSTVDNEEPRAPRATENSRATQLQQFILRDYLAGLGVETSEVKISLREISAQINSLERLAAKGLATRAQLELLVLKRESASARFSRLDKQRKGLLALFPEHFTHEKDATEEQIVAPAQDTSP